MTPRKPSHTLCTLLLLTTTLLQACGFRPLYNHNTTDLSHIHISIIPEHIGQQLRSLLFQNFYTNNPPQNFLYRLTIQPLKPQITTTSIQQNNTPVRRILNITVHYTLSTFNNKNNILLSDTYTASTHYNLSQKPFVNYTTQNNAIQQNLLNIQHYISSSLSLWLKVNTHPNNPHNVTTP